MQLVTSSKQEQLAGENSRALASSEAAGQILLRVCETLDKAGVRYCMLHGYENYPQQIGSDVDILIDQGVTPDELAKLLRNNRTQIGADIVSRRGYCVVLAAKGAPAFLCLDFTTHPDVNGLRFCDGSTVLTGRRRHGWFWIPEVSTEFGCYLARTIAKGSLDERKEMRLQELYSQDPARCERQIENFWSGTSQAVIAAAARSGDWRKVRADLSEFQTELMRSIASMSPGAYFGAKAKRMLGWLGNIWRPQGISVVLLGPDGAGKSSIVDGLPPRVSDVFARSYCWGFAPPLHRLFRRRRQRTDEPHKLPPRAAFVSLVRAGYWFAYALGSELVLRITVARSTLVLYDRHFVDILVDAKRYRYGGPQWILDLIWRFMPKPDLVILLDAPAEVLQQRKQEVPFEETARQRNAYLSLMRQIKNGHIVDASRSREQVADQVVQVIARYLSNRIDRHLGFDADATPQRRALVGSPIES